jgi:hypothetical protein
MLAMPVHDVDDVPRFPKDVVKPQALTATLTLLESPAPLGVGERMPPEPVKHCFSCMTCPAPPVLVSPARLDPSTPLILLTELTAIPVNLIIGFL